MGKYYQSKMNDDSKLIRVIWSEWFNQNVVPLARVQGKFLIHLCLYIITNIFKSMLISMHAMPGGPTRHYRVKVLRESAGRLSR